MGVSHANSSTTCLQACHWSYEQQELKVESVESQRERKDLSSANML